MPDNASLFSSLSKMKVIDKKLLDEAWMETKESGRSFNDVLLGRDLITDENLGKLTADLLKVPFVRLSSLTIDKDVLNSISEEMSKNKKVIVFKVDTSTHVAMIDPEDLATINLIKKKVGDKVRVYYATERDVKAALLNYLTEVSKAFDLEIHKEGVRAEHIVNTILVYAYQARASEVHIEPMADHLSVKYKVDGELKEIVRLPHGWREMLVEEVRSMAPTGIMDFDIHGIEIVRIAVSGARFPSGEKLVMKLLTEVTKNLGLVDLGIDEDDLKKIRESMDEPYGMVWISGPEGSGRTTTAYALCRWLSAKNKKVVSIEDPIEMPIAGIDQIQVNPLTTPSVEVGLQLALEQESDVIMVGEVKDLSVANLALKAATGGRRMITTLGDSDTGKTLNRLFEMGCEPFSVASSTDMVVSQRLVKKICPSCRASKLGDVAIFLNSLPEELGEKLSGKTKIRVYYGKGCDVCKKTGFLGRVGIFEIMLLSEKLRNMINIKSDGESIRKEAVSLGMKTLAVDGWEKVRTGQTTVEELSRMFKD